MARYVNRYQSCGYFIKPLYFIIAINFFLLISCSNPESDAIKAAKKLCDYETDFNKKTYEAYSKLNDSFDSYKFTTRTDVRNKISNMNEELSANYQKRRQEADSLYNKLRGKYITNYQKNMQFEYAYQNYLSANLIKGFQPDELDKIIMQKLLTIIPPKPDAEKIKTDLIGRKISDVIGGYHRKDWYWLVEKDEIQKIDIIDETKLNKDYLYNVRILLESPSGGQQTADVKITYILGNYDDWAIEHLETIDMHIVQTHKYDTCITTENNGWGEISFTNRIDVSLVVGGVLLSYNGEWQKFSIIVDANKTTSIGGFISAYRDIKIHFIERP